jgi:putative N6-adenine-specific DNA methylase
MAATSWTLRVPLDLEKTCATELRALGGGIGKTTWDPGVIYFEGPADAAMRANLHLRCADRVLKPLGAGEASSFHTLRLRMAELPWEEYLPSGSDVRFSVSAMGCKLYHTGAVEDALREGLEGRGIRIAPESDEFPLWIDARGTRDWWTLSIDTSGRGLTRRGYRKATAKAPIRETLAAAVLRAAGYEGTGPLLDPMCGSGTFVIEGAWIASKRAPGLGRSFAFERFPNCDGARWKDLVQKAKSDVCVQDLPRLEGRDSSGGAIQASQGNASRAGVAAITSFTRGKVADLEAREGRGLIVLNPPYGHRLEGEEEGGERVPVSPKMERSYTAWGEHIRAAAPGWDIAIVSPSNTLAEAFGAGPRPKLRFRNGGLSVGLWLLPGR